MAHFDEVLPGRVHRVFYERMVARHRGRDPAAARLLRARLRGRVPALQRDRARGAHGEFGASAHGRSSATPSSNGAISNNGWGRLREALGPAVDRLRELKNELGILRGTMMTYEANSMCGDARWIGQACCLATTALERRRALAQDAPAPEQKARSKRSSSRRKSARKSCKTFRRAFRRSARSSSKSCRSPTSTTTRSSCPA